MTLKHRRIHLFLQLFFLVTGLYEGFHAAQLSLQPEFVNNLFVLQDAQLPVIILSIHVLAMLLCFISCIALWSRAVWSYGVSLFTSGILFALNLFSLSAAIEENSFHIIPIIFILLVLMQSFSFLLRRSYRGA